MTGIGILAVVVSLITWVSNGFTELDIAQFVGGLTISCVLPIITYISAKRNFESNQRMTEPISYEFDATNIHIKGESFNSTLTWAKIHKVTETKDFVLIWQNKIVANAIPKRDFTDENLQAFKQLVRMINGLDVKFND